MPLKLYKKVHSYYEKQFRPIYKSQLLEDKPLKGKKRVLLLEDNHQFKQTYSFNFKNEDGVRKIGKYQVEICDLIGVKYFVAMYELIFRSFYDVIIICCNNPKQTKKYLKDIKKNNPNNFVIVYTDDSMKLSDDNKCVHVINHQYLSDFQNCDKLLINAIEIAASKKENL